jgi:hypothetical protein
MCPEKFKGKDGKIFLFDLYASVGTRDSERGF